MKGPFLSNESEELSQFLYYNYLVYVGLFSTTCNFINFVTRTAQIIAHIYCFVLLTHNVKYTDSVLQLPPHLHYITFVCTWPVCIAVGVTIDIHTKKGQYVPVDRQFLHFLERQFIYS